MSNCFPAGIDIGSTTVKLVILGKDGEILFGQYRRHRAHTQQTLAELLREAQNQFWPLPVAGKNNRLRLFEFGKGYGHRLRPGGRGCGLQSERVAPQTDVAIELGGEDAKIIYFRGGLEQRMNGVCAGGTGSFIDQMASLLQTDAQGLNQAAADYQEIYPIAARCGVFFISRIFSL